MLGLPSLLAAQHQHPAEKINPLSFTPVRAEALSDPELAAYRMESSVMTIVPGGADTVAHRHDCELFGYVLEGSVLIGLERGEPQLYKKGQMFYEKRRILHSLTKNADKHHEAKVLLVFIIKEGRAGYMKEFK